MLMPSTELIFLHNLSNLFLIAVVFKSFRIRIDNFSGCRVDHILCVTVPPLGLMWHAVTNCCKLGSMAGLSLWKITVILREAGS